MNSNIYSSIMNKLSNISWHKPSYSVFLIGIKCNDFQLTWIVPSSSAKVITFNSATIGFADEIFGRSINLVI